MAPELARTVKVAMALQLGVCQHVGSLLAGLLRATTGRQLFRGTLRTLPSPAPCLIRGASRLNGPTRALTELHPMAGRSSLGEADLWVVPGLLQEGGGLRKTNGDPELRAESPPMYPWVKIQIVPPVNIPIPTKIDQTGCTYPKMGSHWF